MELFTAQKLSHPCPVILGVGPYRTFGEPALLAFVERVWEGGYTPCAIIAHQQCDSRLLQWASCEFPVLPSFPDSWEGNLAAIRLALLTALKWQS